MKHLLAFLLCSFILHQATAQLNVDCNGRDQHSLYVVGTNYNIYRIDSVDTHPTDPVLVNTDGIVGGISIGKNIDTHSGDYTMYGVGSGPIYYWGDTGWVNTGHSTTDSGAVNPGSTDEYMFTWDISGQLYRYDGTGNAMLLTSSIKDPNFDITADVATDSAGNYYLLDSKDSILVAYNPNGVPIDSFKADGAINPGGGMSILGSRVYLTNDVNRLASLCEGIITGNSIHFTVIKDLSAFGAFDYFDMASCSNAAQPLAVFRVPDAPHFTIVPNPASTNATARLDNTALLEVFDCLGRRILSVVTRGITQYRLPVNEWNSGIYIITATSESGKVAHSKLVIQ